MKSYENFSRKKTYFAHPMNTYNTQMEIDIVNKLEEYGFEVLNPNTVENQENFKVYRKENPTNYMNFFDNLVNQCNSVSYLPFENGRIGAGIVFECKTAHKNNLIIYEIDYVTNEIKPVSIEYIIEKSFSVEETRDYFRKNKK